MRAGEYILAKSRLEFLKKFKNYHFLFDVVPNEPIWFVRCDGKVRNGWKVYPVSNDVRPGKFNRTIPDPNSVLCEERTSMNCKIDPFYTLLDSKGKMMDRIVVEIDDSMPYRKYVFIGVYRLIVNLCHWDTVRYYERISDFI